MIDIEVCDLTRKGFWAASVHGKLRCPKCKSIVVELWSRDFSELEYKCSDMFCHWHRIIDLKDTQCR